MGLFLSLSGVIGKSQNNVVNCLNEFCALTGGNVVPQQLSFMDDNCCVIASPGANTSVLYPNNFLDWDNASANLSRQLQVPVFSFHIHDGDLWMYILYVNGEAVDQFNPIPDYWSELPENEADSWRGDADIVARYVPGVDKAGIANYLVRWNFDEEQPGKAYDTDTYQCEDWQLIDFMKKLNLAFPLNDDGSANGNTFAFTTKKPPVKPVAVPGASPRNTNKTGQPASKTKPWWKFW